MHAVFALALIVVGAHVAPARAAQNEVFYCTSASAPDGGNYAACGGSWSCGLPSTGNELTLRNYATDTLVRWSEIASTDTVPVCGLVNGQPSTSASVDWLSKAAFLAGGAVMQTAALETTSSRRPAPPTSICINNKCANTGTNATASTGAGAIKWNPGHYMATLGIEDGGTTSTTWTDPGSDGELAALASSSGVVGYKAVVFWGSIEGPKQGQINFALLDSLMSKLAAMSPSRHLVLVVLPGAFTGTTLAGRSDVLPAYLLNDPQYGPSPVAGSYGWWGGSTNSQPPVACIHRPAVAQAYGKMLAAIAAHYDSNPLFEGLLVQEDSWMYGACGDKPAAPDFSDAGFISGVETALSLAVASAPHTNIAMQNTWTGYATPTQDLETWMYLHRVLAASTDTAAESYIQANGLLSLPWGINAYMGLTASGSSWSGPDLRPMTHAWCDVEGPELGYLPNLGVPGKSVLDIIKGINDYYQGSHTFWTYLPSGFSSSPSWAWWPNLLSVIQANPLTTTSYPKVYPK